MRVSVTLLLALAMGVSAHARSVKGVSVVARDVVREERGKRWAVLIGVDRYDDKVGIGSLRFSGADVKLLHHVLTGPNGGFAPGNVLLMTADAGTREHTPTYAHIVSLVPEWLARARPEDDVLLAFSGHGVTRNGEAYLLPSTARFADLRRTAIPLSLVRRWMEACRAERKILIVDACHAGAGKDVPAMDERFWRDLDRGHGFIRLASCGPDQKSNEDARLKSAVGKGHGVFTYYLAEGLAGPADFDRDGRVDVDEVYLYAYKRTRLWARKRGVRQDPMKSGTVTGVMTVCYRGIPGMAPPSRRVAGKTHLETVPGSNRQLLLALAASGWRSRPVSRDMRSAGFRSRSAGTKSPGTRGSVHVTVSSSRKPARRCAQHRATRKTVRAVRVRVMRARFPARRYGCRRRTRRSNRRPGAVARMRTRSLSRL